MNKEQLPEYIAALVQESPPPIAALGEIDNAILLLHVYICGLEGKDFPIGNLGVNETNVIPAPFHTAIAQLAILKSGEGGRGRDYLLKSLERLLKRLPEYFVRHL